MKSVIVGLILVLITTTASAQISVYTECVDGYKIVIAYAGGLGKGGQPITAFQLYGTPDRNDHTYPERYVEPIRCKPKVVTCKDCHKDVNHGQ